MLGVPEGTEFTHNSCLGKLKEEIMASEMGFWRWLKVCSSQEGWGLFQGTEGTMGALPGRLGMCIPFTNRIGQEVTEPQLTCYFTEHFFFFFFFKGCFIIDRYTKSMPLRRSLQNSIPNVRRAQLPPVKGVCVWSAQLQCLSLFLCGTKLVSCPWRYPGCRQHLSSPRLQVPAYSPNQKLPKPQCCWHPGKETKGISSLCFSLRLTINNNTRYWRSTFLKGAQSAFQTLPHNIPVILTWEVAPKSTALLNHHKKSRNQWVIYIPLRIKVGLLKYH